MVVDSAALLYAYVTKGRIVSQLEWSEEMYLASISPRVQLNLTVSPFVLG